MRRSLAGAVGALVLGWLSGVAPALAPAPALTMPAPLPSQLPEAVAPAAVPEPGTCGPHGLPVLGYGYDPAAGILIFTPHDDPSYLMWEGYTGHGRPPAWFSHCRSWLGHLCGR